MKLLIVDDDAMIVDSLCEALAGPQVEIDRAEDGKTAYRMLAEGAYDAALLDLVLPEMNGIELLKKLAPQKLRTEIVMITGFGSIETAIEAMRHGASDYLTKPVNLDELRHIIRRIRERVALEEENRALKDMLKNRDQFREMVGNTPAMQRIKETILQVAAKKVTVLIEGESGTGKELVANALYQNSNRRNKPFLKINCGALSQGILESELFGHEKGSFTGAIAQKKGIFESANGGTIFLDEIGEMPFESQVKLLRVLETGEFSRVGGVQALKSNVRIIAATNKDLEQLVQAGGFREDLYYRLKVITIQLPPLRERLEDIPFLVKRFIEMYNLENDASFRGVTMEVQDYLAALPWKGNIRELRNVVEKILVFAKHEEIEMEDLPDDLLKQKAVGPVDLYQGTMAQIEKQVIEKAMTQTGGNIRRVSRILDIPLRTLYRKLKNFGIGT